MLEGPYIYKQGQQFIQKIPKSDEPYMHNVYIQFIWGQNMKFINMNILFYFEKEGKDEVELLTA